MLRSVAMAHFRVQVPNRDAAVATRAIAADALPADTTTTPPLGGGSPSHACRKSVPASAARSPAETMASRSCLRLE